MVINKVKKSNMNMENTNDLLILKSLKALINMTDNLKKVVSYNGSAWMEGDLVSIKDSFSRLAVKLEGTMAQTKSFKK